MYFTFLCLNTIIKTSKEIQKKATKQKHQTKGSDPGVTSEGGSVMIKKFELFLEELYAEFSHREK